MAPGAPPASEHELGDPLSALHMHAVTVVFIVWTLLMSVLAVALHLLTLGYGDVSMWVARRMWAPPLLAFARIRLDLQGGEHLRPDQPYVAVANHQSAVDILVLFLALPHLPIRFMAKQGLFWIPVFGWYLWLTGYVAVDRRSRSRGRRSLARAAVRVRRSNTTIVVFPEGTRTPDGSVKRFRTGAFVLAQECKAPIVPVALAGGYAVMNRHRWHVRRGTIHARVLPPIPPQSSENNDRKDIAELAQRVVTDEVARLRAQFDIEETDAVSAEPSLATAR